MDSGIDSTSTTKTIQPDSVRMTGFLEKKGKMKLISPWKKYWFVLEKRLLLYYRSEIEYANLSPCRGSLNMGLVTTVRPGSSSGPCVIHIVTRTQAMQLRAKNRAAQEEWLQALLNSMTFSFVPKSLKPPFSKPKLISHTASLDNVWLYNGWKRTYSGEDWSLPRGLNYRKRQICGSYYGGSLDTTIWTKKFRPIRTPKGKTVEMYLESSKESDLKYLATSSHRELRGTSYHDARSYPTDKNLQLDKILSRKNEGRKCKVHDDKLNRSSFSECPHELNEQIKKMNVTKVHPFNSDNEVSKTEMLEQSRMLDKKYESPFEKLKHVLGRMPKEKILRFKPEVERRGSTKRRRKSFLQKVFRRMGNESQESSEFEIDAGFYDMINPTQRNNETVVKKKSIDRTEEVMGKQPAEPMQKNENVMYAEIKKNVGGPKTIISEFAESEMKTRITTSDGRLEECVVPFENVESTTKTMTELAEAKSKEEKRPMAPLLPPRRVSRPVSPWHDVPTNNAPIDSEKKAFFSHQSVVKFKDSFIPADGLCDEDYSKSFDQLTTIRGNKTNPTEPEETARENDDSESREECKSDDLSLLLEQLTKITVAPLEESSSSNDPMLCSSDSMETSSRQPEIQDPDYDVPRPHKDLNIILPDFTQNQVVSPSDVDHLINKYHENLEKGWSLRSMEPDSLELFAVKEIKT